MINMVRERPFAAAATAAGAAAAGLFLWSKRAQISDQLSGLGDQFGQWTDDMRARDESASAARPTRPSANARRSSTARVKAEPTETGSADEVPAT
jgi:hypothetical protein